MWQNVNNEVLLAWFKFQAKIPSRSGVCVQGEWQKYTPPSPPLSKDEGLKNIGHSMSIRNLIFGVNSVTVSYLIRYDSLLQNATDIITKCDSYFIIKCDRSLLQNASGFLLQNATVIIKCGNFITKCDSASFIYNLSNYPPWFIKQLPNSVAESLSKNTPNPAGNHMLKFNNRNTRTRCEMCSKLTVKTPEQHQLSK